MKAEEVLNHQLDWRGKPPITDGEIVAICDKCATRTNLGACTTEPDADGLTYRCDSCGEIALIVADFVEGTQPWAGRGYRLGPWVLRNLAELQFRGIAIPTSINSTIKK